MKRHLYLSTLLFVSGTQRRFMNGTIPATFYCARPRTFRDNHRRCSRPHDGNIIRLILRWDVVSGLPFPLFLSGRASHFRGPGRRVDYIASAVCFDPRSSLCRRCVARLPNREMDKQTCEKCRWCSLADGRAEKAGIMGYLFQIAWSFREFENEENLDCDPHSWIKHTRLHFAKLVWIASNIYLRNDKNCSACLIALMMHHTPYFISNLQLIPHCALCLASGNVIYETLQRQTDHYY